MFFFEIKRLEIFNINIWVVPNRTHLVKSLNTNVSSSSKPSYQSPQAI